MLVENLLAMSLLSQRIIHDHMNAAGKESHDFDIDRDLSLDCKGAHSCYTTYLDEKKKDAVMGVQTNKRRHLNDELSQVKRSKLNEEASICDMKTNVDKFMIEAGAQKDLQEMKKYVDKANSFRETIRKKEIVIADLDMEAIFYRQYYIDTPVSVTPPPFSLGLTVIASQLNGLHSTLLKFHWGVISYQLFG